MNAKQLQIQKDPINAKLDRIASMLEILVQMREEESYPPETKMKKSFIKECQKILKELKNSRASGRTYKSMAAFTKSLS